jgi:hypothetical protein
MKHLDCDWCWDKLISEKEINTNCGYARGHNCFDICDSCYTHTFECSICFERYVNEQCEAIWDDNGKIYDYCIDCCNKCNYNEKMINVVRRNPEKLEQLMLLA